MRLALLCDGPAVIPWLDAIAAGSAHEIVVAVNVSPLGAELLRGRSGIRIAERWEDLLVARDIDAIMVGGHDPIALEAIKQLAAAGHAIVFLPEAAQGSTFLYELSLIRDDNRVKLFPALWHRHDPALVRLRALLQDGSLGAVKLIQLDRAYCWPPGMPLENGAAIASRILPPLGGEGRGGGKEQVSGLLIDPPPSLTLPAEGREPEQEREVIALPPLKQTIVDHVLLPDIDLLRWLGGDYDQATALRTCAVNDELLMQTVTLAGRGLPEATWHMQTTAGPSVSVLTVHAERGQVIAELGLPADEWTLTEPDGTKVVGNQVTAARERLAEIEALLPQGDSLGEWPALVKVFETLDATHRSVKRRRTIDLHFEPMSERAAFKTQMIAMGCGVLTATLMLMLAYLAVASFVPSEETERLQWLQSGTAALDSVPPASNWRHARTALAYARLLVFTPLAIFLVLQLLYPLSRPTTTAADTSR